MARTFARVASAVLLLGGLNVGLVVTPAEANPAPVSPIRRCGFASVTDPTIEDGETQTGAVTGGPIFSTTPGAMISMTCTIQAGGGNGSHSGADACAVTGPAGLGVTSVQGTCSYVSPENQPVFLCTHVIVNGVSWYWNSAGTNATTTPLDGVVFTGEWSTESSVLCDEAIQQEIFPGPLGPVFEEIDRTICGPLGSLAPGVPGVLHITPEGDVYIGSVWFWDCPPYGNPIETTFVAPERAKVTITDFGAGPTVIPTSGFVCDSGTVVDGNLFLVTCHEPGLASNIHCTSLTVTVTANSDNNGEVIGTIQCGTDTLTVSVSTPPGGTASDTAPTDERSTTWYCGARVTGNPEPWMVTCVLHYHRVL